MGAIRAEHACVLLAVVFGMHSLMSRNEVSDPRKLRKSQGKRMIFIKPLFKFS